MPGELLILSSDRLISSVRDVWLVFLYYHVLVAFHFNANSVDPVQRPRSVASDPGLLGLPMSLIWDARNDWVNSLSYLNIVQVRFTLFVCLNHAE